MADRSPRDTALFADLGSILERVTGRSRSLFQTDLERHDARIREQVQDRRILVTGAAGSIGSATVRQLTRYRPALLAAIDLSENNLVEVVRDLRSRAAIDGGDVLRTFVVDFGSNLGDLFVREIGPFDLVLHFAAMKHVRSERDVFSLSRLVRTNVLQVDRFLGALKRWSPCDVFAISSDKACAPANAMGATKRLMEQIVFWHGQHPGSLLGEGPCAPLPRVACTRFANVAFSDGSLLASYLLRIQKRQPLAGPNDVRRYFISEEEAGQLCLMTAALAHTREIFVPALDPSRDVKSFDEIAEIVLEACGFEPRWYDSDEEARRAIPDDLAQGRYPCCFSPSDTSGEKEEEEFVGPGEQVVTSDFEALQVIGESPMPEPALLKQVVEDLARETAEPDPAVSKARILGAIERAVPTLTHHETGRSLDEKM